MPTPLTYPGVYIEEIPSGVRTITGVATSITAFVGRTAWGPAAGGTDSPTLINSWAEFERRFGGLDVHSPLSYAVRDFYLNGGSQALVVRVAPASSSPPASAATISLGGGGSPPADLVLTAASVGEWGRRLFAQVDIVDAAVTSPPVSPPTSPPTSGLFNLTVEFQLHPDREEVAREVHLNLSLDQDHPRYVGNVLANESSLVRATAVPATIADVARTAATGGSDGGALTQGEVQAGVQTLKKADVFNLLCIPPLARDTPVSDSTYQAALQLCVEERAMLIVDPNPSWGANPDTAVTQAKAGVAALGLSGNAARNAAVYFPAVRQRDPLRDNQIETFAPCGIVAGVMARTDSARGVWKAPAGLDASLNGVQGLQTKLTDAENGSLNQLGINCLRAFPVHGRVVWGARTMRGADQSADEYKYVPVRRLALFIEESLYRGTQWVVFEPNDEPLWGQIRLAVGAFMQNLFRQGAFQGSSPREAYLVKCDAETTTQNDINLGIVNILVGFAPLKPAEFVVIKIQQLAGQAQE